MLTDIPAPWKGFLEKLDTLLEEPVRLDCIGGFAVVMGYGLPRAHKRLGLSDAQSLQSDKCTTDRWSSVRTRERVRCLCAIHSR